jgi:2-polyprenyl-3-methyl-5-hydroxy-6-metoxy-1,4-benzoquinol methylase
MSFAARVVVPELMDDPTLDPRAHTRALAGLARLNGVSGAAGRLAGPLAALARRLGRPVNLLDVATGGGDMPVAIARRGLPVNISGCDLSPTALAHAADLATGCGVTATWFRHDLLAGPPPGRFDAVTCNLFLHHLADADAITALRHMAAAADHLVLVSDLVRGRFSHALVWLGSRLFSRSPVVRFDGPASVRAAFTAAELAKLADTAGLTGATVRRTFPCRMLLRWERT